MTILEYISSSCSRQPVREARLKVIGLTEDCEYEFRVSAENKAGVGPVSGTSELAVACDPICEQHT